MFETVVFVWILILILVVGVVKHRVQMQLFDFRNGANVAGNGARDLANLAVDRLLHRMDTKANVNDGVREYRVGARVVKRDSCRRIEPSRASKSARSKSSAKA